MNFLLPEDHAKIRLHEQNNFYKKFLLSHLSQSSTSVNYLNWVLMQLNIFNRSNRYILSPSSRLVLIRLHKLRLFPRITSQKTRQAIFLTNSCWFQYRLTVKTLESPFKFALISPSTGASTLLADRRRAISTLSIAIYSGWISRWAVKIVTLKVW